MQKPETEATRVIKKYRNRRLYDTGQSCYITLEQVRELVLGRVAFVVQDAKSGEDLTRSVLLQILLEEETDGDPMFSETALSEMIRFYGGTMQGFMRTYLERNIQAIVEMQASLAKHSGTLTPEFWTQLMRAQSVMMRDMTADHLERSSTLLLKMQEQMSRHAEQALEALGVRR